MSSPTPGPHQHRPPKKRASLLRRTWVWLLPAGIVAWLAPAVPALARYGTVPRAPDATRTILVAGVSPEYAGHHTRAPEDFTGLTDTIALVQLRATEPVVRILNIPRDTWTSVPGWGMSKINAANVRGGPEALVGAVQNLTGLSVDGYVLLSLEALRDLTDAAGGVTVTVEQPMQYTDEAADLHIDFQPGTYVLSGEQAEAYLRFRKDNLGDIGRVQRQQAFIRTLGDKLTSPLGAVYAPSVAGALEKNVRTNLSRAQVGQVLGALLRRPQVQTELLPGSFGGGGTWAPDRAAIQELVRTSFAPEAMPGNPRGLRVNVLNVGAPAGSATRLKSRLEGLGYRSVSAGNGTGDPQRTVIVAADVRAAQRVRADLGFGEVRQAPPGSGADVVVQLGADVPPGG